MPKFAVILAAAFLTNAAASAFAVSKDDLIAAHGADEWEDVKSVAFTFHVEKPGLSVERTWEWNVAEDTVTLTETGEGGVATETKYSRDPSVCPLLRSKSDKKDKIDKTHETDLRSKTDKKFINDSFWLLWPVHLMWSEDVEVTDEGVGTDPISGEERTRVRIAYPDTEDAGYTPGDHYVLYVDETNKPTAWEYFPGGQATAALTTTWEEYQEFGPLTLSTEHEGPEGRFRLWFSDVVVETGE
ncbi:MAG: hypothetical protein RLY93_16395 [Sumerlaeia bacterium]